MPTGTRAGSTIATAYYLLLKDHTGATVAQFTGGGRGRSLGGLQSFSYRKRLRTPGATTVRIHGDDDRIADYLTLPDHLDYQWEFWRFDPLVADDYYRDHESFHRGEELQQLKSGQLVYTSRGQGYNVLMYGETIRYDKGTAQALKIGDTASVAYAYVNENIGPAAGVDDNGDSRARTGLSLAAVTAAGVNWQGDRADKLLADVLLEIGNFTPADYMITGNGAAVFLWQWRNTRWGLDRTAGNPDGNAPLRFSALSGNVYEVQSSYDHLDAVTTVYMLGQGSGALRRKRTISDATLLGYSPWARRAVSRSDRNEYSGGSLDDRGEAIIDEQRARRRMSFQVQQTRAVRYGRDWNMGDLVEVEDYLGNVNDMKIVGVTITVDKNGVESISPEFEEE